jgi:ribosomal protein L4
MRLPVHNAQGKRLRQITVDDSVFGITPNMAVLHQAFVAQRANQRRGTASTRCAWAGASPSGPGPAATARSCSRR